MTLGGLELEGTQRREAVEMFVSICQTYRGAELLRPNPPGRVSAGASYRSRQTVYPAYNPPSDRGELYLGELERAGLVKVQRYSSDPADGPYIPDLAFAHGTTTIVEPTEEAYREFERILGRAKDREFKRIIRSAKKKGKQ